MRVELVALQNGPWSEPELEKLRGLHTDGLTMSAMAIILNRSRNSVISKCHYLGLPPREGNAGGKREQLFDEAKLATLNREFANNQPVYAIAEACGVTYDQMRKKLARLGLKPGERSCVHAVRPPPPKDEPPACCDAAGALFSLLTIPNAGLCKWPQGDVGAEDFHLCGNSTKAGPYCAHHDARAHVRPAKAA